MGVWGARTGKRVKVNSCNVILITGTVGCLISEWMHQCLEQIQWITVYIYIQNGISWILRSWRYDLSNLYNPDKTWNSRERNVAIGLPDSPQWKWRVNTKWVKCNDEEQMQMGIEVLWWLNQAYPPQFITLRCQNWLGETLGRWCCQSMCSENGVKMLVKMDRAQCRGVNADGDLMVIDPDGSLLDQWARVDEEVAGW